MPYATNDGLRVRHFAQSRRPTPSGAATNSSSRQEQKIAPKLMTHFGSCLADDVWLDEFTNWLLRTTWNIENTGKRFGA
jgi:hypothetical protein